MSYSSDYISYWYKGVGGVDVNASIPIQAIPKSKKNEKWVKACLDAFERIGVEQLRENIKFNDFYRMIDGRMSYTELSEVIPQLREVEEIMSDFNIDSQIKHYDIIGVVINALVGEYIQNADKYWITNDDEIAQNEYIRQKTQMYRDYVKQTFDKELKIAMLRKGMNPEPNRLDFEDEQQMQEYIQQLLAFKADYSPQDIEKYMTEDWKTIGVKWGEMTIEWDTLRMHLEEKDVQNLIDYFGTGRAFRELRITNDGYEHNVWSPKNTFFSKYLDIRYPQEADYVGRVHFYTKSQVISKWGNDMSAKTKEQILGGDDSYNGRYSSNKGGGSTTSLFDSLWETQYLPSENYHDYNFMLGLQDNLGIPLGTAVYKDANGNMNEMPRYFPKPFKGGNTSVGSNLAQLIRDDIKLRKDLLQVTEVYWISYKKIGYFTYREETGRLNQEIVTEDILSDFIKELGIKTLKNKSFNEITENPEENTICWDYVPEVRYGVKINNYGTSLEEPIYIGGEPLEYQIKGYRNKFDVLLPVAGIVSSSLAQKIYPMQVAFNVAMNQAFNFMQKEIGTAFIVDLKFLPAEYKNMGGLEETLMYMRNMIQDYGFIPYDTSSENVRGGNPNMSSILGQHNMSFAPQISERFAVAQHYKQMAFEQVGINPQRLGMAVKYETAEGVRLNQNASYSQTEKYFEEFSSFKKRMLNMHLAVAQYVQGSGRDVSVYYTKSDSTKAFLKFSDPNFPLRDLGVMVASNAKERKKLETFRQHLLSNNTMGADELTIWGLINSDSTRAVLEVAKQARMLHEERSNKQHEQNMEAMERQAEIVKEQMLFKHQLDEDTNEKDRKVRIQVETQEALGRAADKNSDPHSFNQIKEFNKQSLQLQKMESDNKYREESLSHQKEVDKEKLALDAEKLKIEFMKAKAKLEEAKNAKYIATINKN